MNKPLERVPDEPPSEVEEITELTEREREKLVELAVMMKANRLFSFPRAEDDPYRSPDDVTKYELLTEVISFLRDKEDRRRLVYRRLLNGDELVLDSQVVEFRESGSAAPIVITCDRFPDSEVLSESLREVEEFLDCHLAKHEDQSNDPV